MNILAIAVGSYIKSNDPRDKDKPKKQVLSIDATHAIYRAGRRMARVRLDRIYHDGKARNTGWSIVS